jgi:hypothetical protein
VRERNEGKRRAGRARRGGKGEEGGLGKGREMKVFGKMNV